MFSQLLLAVALCAQVYAQPNPCNQTDQTTTNQTSDQNYTNKTSDQTNTNQTSNQTNTNQTSDQTNSHNQIWGGAWQEVFLNSKECDTCRSAMETMRETSVGFIATGAETSQNDIIFPAVYRNIGQAYNETTGKFTAPLTGTNHFVASLSPSLENVQEHVQKKCTGKCTGK